MKDSMSKNNHSSEAILKEKLANLSRYLTEAMREIREKTGLTQAQLAEKLGVQQAAISKLESSEKEHKLESIVQYLQALDAELLILVKHQEELYPVSDGDGEILIDIPQEIKDLAENEGISVREFLRNALENLINQEKSMKSPQTNLKILTFLESEDDLAIKVRERLQDKSLSELAKELEKCLTLNDNDPVDEICDFLSSESLETVEMNRSDVNAIAYDAPDIQVYELAEELWERIKAMFNNFSEHNESESVIYADFSEMATDLDYQQEELERSEMDMTQSNPKKALFQKWDGISDAKAQALREEFSQEDKELAESGLSDYLDQLKLEDQA